MRIQKIRDVKTPERGTKKSAGLDFFIPNDWQPKGTIYSKTKFLISGESILIPSGIRVDIPKGYALIAHDKSSVCTELGLKVGASVIDEDYQGELHLHIMNVNSHRTIELYNGMKLVQFLLIPVAIPTLELIGPEEVLFKNETKRGKKGFGSTDEKRN